MSSKGLKEFGALEESVEHDGVYQLSQLDDAAEEEVADTEAGGDSNTSDESSSDQAKAQRAHWAAQRDAHYQSIDFQPRPMADFHEKDTERFRHLDHIELGAIMQPPNGPDVKSGDGSGRCMTCVRYDKPCTGTSVVKGKCEQCTKNPDIPGSKDRRCIWMNAEKNLWNYNDGHEAAGFKGGNYNYTYKQEVEDLAGFNFPSLDFGSMYMGGEPVRPRMEYPTPQPPVIHIFDVNDARQRNLLQWAAEQIMASATALQGNTPLENLRRLSLTIEARNPLAGITDGNFQERIEETRAQMQVHVLLRRMLDDLVGLDLDQLDDISRWVREE